LTEANYQSVATVLSKDTVPVYYENTAALEADVLGGIIVAGLSTTRTTDQNFIFFGSDIISSQGIFFGNHLRPLDIRRVNEAIVNVRATQEFDRLFNSQR
jgi:hypothetical protein